jgi:hypothetical protein
MKIQAAFSNGGSIFGTCWVEIEGPSITDAEALNLAQAILGSDYATVVFSQESGTPTVDHLEVVNLTRGITIP